METVYTDSISLLFELPWPKLGSIISYLYFLGICLIEINWQVFKHKNRIKSEFRKEVKSQSILACFQSRKEFTKYEFIIFKIREISSYTSNYI